MNPFEIIGWLVVGGISLSVLSWIVLILLGAGASLANHVAGKRAARRRRARLGNTPPVGFARIAARR